MEARYTEGKALWQKRIRRQLLGMDAENGLRFILNLLEESRHNPLHREMLMHLYGGSPYADRPVRLGNDAHSITLRNRLGVPAGFTKDALGLLGLDDLDVGSIEIGTIVPRPQEGNPKPRFFLNWKGLEDIFFATNSFGFNCEEGVAGPVARVRNIWSQYGYGHIRATLIWSIGPNKTTVEEYGRTGDLRLIARDFAYALMHIMPVLRPGDAIQFNVASPNTEDLRKLFDVFRELLSIIFEQLDAIAEFFGIPIPGCIIKFSPDMDEPQMRGVISAMRRHKMIVALEAFNTTLDAFIKARHNVIYHGGISGDAIREYALKKLITLYRIMDEEDYDLDTIVVGGMSKSEHVMERLRAGRQGKVAQFLTGFLKEGFSLIPEVLETLATVA